MRIVVKFVITALAIFFIANSSIVPGISVDGFGIALLVAVVLGMVNVLIKPILFILTLPFTIITFGIFALILNALLFWLVAVIVPGFLVEGFFAAFLGSLLVSTVQWSVDKIL